MKNSNQILIAGAGPMAIEYAKALKKLNYPFLVVGRSQQSATEFEKITGIKVITGGIDKYLNQNKNIPVTAIVAVSEEHLGDVTIKLLKKGAKTILTEKPAGLDFEDVKKVCKLSEKLNAKVYVGYNRRFYASVKKALEIIKKDHGISSIFFDFTEASFRITPLKKAPGVKKNWFLQNSTHVLDLAFFLSGTPKKGAYFTSGKLNWHPKGAIFTGAGVTKKEIPFSYHANWDAPGRWSMEIQTKRNKLIFKPLEKLQIQEFGTFTVKEIVIDDNIDIEIKAGIFKEVESFLTNKKDLCTISEQVENIDFYQQILEGNQS